MALTCTGTLANQNSAGGTSIALAGALGAVAVGDIIDVYGAHDQTSVTYSCADDLGGGSTANVYTQRNALSGSAVARTVSFTCQVTKAGTPIVTLTFSSSTANRCILCNIIKGAAVSYWTKNGQRQPTPSTTADLTTSGNGAVLSTATGLYTGLSARTSGSNGPNAGTGYTSLGLFWNLGSTLARAEYKNVSVTTADAATFTALGNDEHYTMMHAYVETTLTGQTLT